MLIGEEQLSWLTSAASEKDRAKRIDQTIRLAVMVFLQGLRPAPMAATAVQGGTRRTNGLVPAGAATSAPTTPRILTFIRMRAERAVRPGRGHTRNLHCQMPREGADCEPYQSLHFFREEKEMQLEAARAIRNATTARPEFTEIINRIRKLAPEIDSRALAAEKAKRVPAETMEALRDADVFRTMQPKRFGGYEYGPAELAQIGFELGRACGSTGWCGTLAVCFGWMTAFFPLEAQQEVWDDHRQSARRLLRADPEGRSGRRRPEDFRKLAVGERRGQRRLAHSVGADSRQGRSAGAGLVPGSDPRRDRRSRELERLRLAGHGLEDGRRHRPGVRAAAPRAADERDFFRQGPGARCARQRSGALRLSRLSVRPRWSRRSSAWRKARSTLSPTRRAAPSAWRGRVSSRRSPNRR